MKVEMTGHHFGNNLQISKKSLKPWYMGAQQKGLSKSFQMNTNMSLDGFQKTLRPCALDEK